MAVIVPFEGRLPRIAASAFIAQTAVLVGDVEIGEGASVWFGAVLRGDLGPIKIGARSNVQDNCVIHSETAEGTVLGEDVTIGHGAVLHDCRIGRGSLVGIKATVLDHAQIGEEVLIAAGSVVLAGFVAPDRSLVAGIPAVVKRTLEGDAASWVARAADDYTALQQRYRAKPAV